MPQKTLKTSSRGDCQPRLVNITLVVWIVWLYQRRYGTLPRELDEAGKQEIFSLLRQQLEEEKGTLAADFQLKEDMRKEALEIADVSSRLQERLFLTAEPGAAGPLKKLQQVLRDTLQQVMREKSLIDLRDAQLERSFQETRQDLRDAVFETQAPQQLVDDVVFGPLTSTASGLLAGLDLAIAAQAMLFAVLLTATKQALPGFDKAAETRGEPNEESKSSERGSKSKSKKSQTAEAPKEAPSNPKAKVVLRFYGRWDNEDSWVLLQSVPLKGIAGTLVGAVRGSRAVVGSKLSNRILTALVARSARGMVQRRGWKPIVEKTMEEVGRDFCLGYLVEPSAASATPRISVLSRGKHVEEVPNARILRSK
ncbi:PP5 [Symbiodinium sp. CCMP2592]|nr:PP5 [Symbiodinium sp. CCMP2592]